MCDVGDHISGLEQPDDTTEILKSIPGGAELVVWFSGFPDFHDAEVLSLNLDRRGTSELKISTHASATLPIGGPPYKHAVVTFAFSRHSLIDVSLKEFSRQNVIYGLTLRKASKMDDAPPTESDLQPSLVDIELEPSFGAFGTLHATIEKITITPVDDYQKADAPPSMTE